MIFNGKEITFEELLELAGYYVKGIENGKVVFVRSDRK